MRTILAACTIVLMSSTAHADELDDLTQLFEEWSGASLVFERSQLPRGSWFEKTPAMTHKRRLDAARILVKEVMRYPPGYLKHIGFRTFGAFDACADPETDGFRPYLKRLGGYRYFGLWNGRDAAIGAYYTDGQLPLTFHHEIFHHVDATQGGRTSRANFLSDDPRFRAAVKGKQRYAAPRLSNAIIRALKSRSGGNVLRSAVSDYSDKASGEDQAETARYVMSHLADALVQVVEQPNLPGSQRILHILRAYQLAATDGPTVDWFIRLALLAPPLADASH